MIGVAGVTFVCGVETLSFFGKTGNGGKINSLFFSGSSGSGIGCTRFGSFGFDLSPVSSFCIFETTRSFVGKSTGDVNIDCTAGRDGEEGGGSDCAGEDEEGGGSDCAGEGEEGGGSDWCNCG